MRIYAYHGVMEKERRGGQYFIVDIELETDLSKAGRSDNLNDTIDYASVYGCISKIVVENKYMLLEKLAESICSSIIINFKKIETVKICVKKPEAPIDGEFNWVGVEIKRSRWNEVFLSLGSNMGDREIYLREAVDKIKNLTHVKVYSVAPIYETLPVGNTQQEMFLNTALRMFTSLSPCDLLHELQNIENLLGRKREERWGPRTIDIDILTYGNLSITSEELVIPHPEMLDRKFVMLPLSKIIGEDKDNSVIFFKDF